jgi:hypothetical protein
VKAHAWTEKPTMEFARIETVCLDEHFGEAGLFKAHDFIMQETSDHFGPTLLGQSSIREKVYHTTLKGALISISALIAMKFPSSQVAR